MSSVSRLRRPAVLAYHAIGRCERDDDVNNLFVTPEQFEKQMAHLARHRLAVDLDALVAGERGVAVTFDDAYANLVELALPVLVAHGVTASVFLPTAFVGDRNRWDAPSACDLSIMNVDHLKTWVDAGMRVESHGHGHIDMRHASADDVRTDLVRSREAIEAMTGRAPRYLAWPFATGSPEARSVAADIGFTAAFSIDLRHDGRFAWERTQVTPLDGERLFALKATGWYLPLRTSTAVDVGYRAVKRIVHR